VEGNVGTVFTTLTYLKEAEKEEDYSCDHSQSLIQARCE
jgi:hypothetical protein